MGALGHSAGILVSKDFGKHHFDFNETAQWLGRPGASGFDRDYFTALAYSHGVTGKVGRDGRDRRVQPHQRDDAGDDDDHGSGDLQLVFAIDFRLGRLFRCLRKSAASYFFLRCDVLGCGPIPPQRKK